MITEESILAYHEQGSKTIVTTDSSNILGVEFIFSYAKINYYILLYFFLKIRILLNAVISWKTKSYWPLFNIINNENPNYKQQISQ